ncbi:hypothetical protein ACFVTZ_13650 [Cellulosimicrobium cellulans]|uniref:hypothetical protein n=1 Tax=Cellulosimicrobium cellulans TaxID=1710 RepID=UPI0036EE0973
MNPDVLVAVVGAVALLLTTWFRQPFRRDPRDHIERDIKIAAELPPGSDAREALEEDIQRRVTGLVPNPGMRRDWFGFILALAFMSVFVFLTWRFWTWGGWWNIGTAVTGFLSLVMLGLAVRDFRKAPRDAQGRLAD